MKVHSLFPVFAKRFGTMPACILVGHCVVEAEADHVEFSPTWQAFEVGRHAFVATLQSLA